MDRKKVFKLAAIATVVALPVYGIRHVAHVKCVDAALARHCMDMKEGFQLVERIAVPKWRVFGSYRCSAKVWFRTGVKEVTFTARHGGSSPENDNFGGFWKVLGGNYQIEDVKCLP